MPSLTKYRPPLERGLMKKLLLTLLPLMALPAWANDIELNIKSHCTIEVHGKKLVNTEPGKSSGWQKW